MNNIVQELQQKHYGSLRATMLGWFFLLAFLPLMLVSGVGYYQARLGVIEMASQRLDDSSKLAARYIYMWFNDRKRDVEYQASLPDNAVFLRSLQRGYTQSKNDLQHYVKSYDWVLRAEKQQTTLLDFYYRHHDIYDIFLITKHGDVLFSIAHEADLGTNLYHGKYVDTRFAKTVIHTLETGQTYFSDLEHYAPSGGAVAGFLTAAMIDDQGNRVGVLAFQLKIERFFQTLNATESVDERHYLVGRDRVLRNSLSQGGDRALSTTLGTDILVAWQQGHNLDEQGHIAPRIYPGILGDLSLGVLQELHLAGVHWALVSEVPESVALKSVNSLAKFIFLIVFALAFLVGVLSLLISGRITRPLHELSIQALRVALGKRGHSVKVDQNNEIGQLADALNHMMLARENQERELKTLSRIACQTTNGIVITNAEGLIEWVNDGFSLITGYGLDELVGNKPGKMLQGQATDPEVVSRMRDALKSHEPFHEEVTNYHKSGRQYWVDIACNPMHDDDGALQGFMAIEVDITAAKNIEIANQNSLRYNQVLAELSIHPLMLEANVELAKQLLVERVCFALAVERAGIWMMSEDGEKIVCSAFYDSVADHFESGMVVYRKDCPQYFSELFRRSFISVEHAQTDFATCELANDYLIPNGILSLLDCVISGGKGIVGVLCVESTAPLARQWSAPEETFVSSIATMISGLHSVQLQRMTERELIRAKDVAEAAAHAKGEFLASMSHEIRTPMNGVIGMLNLLNRSHLNEKQKRQATIARTSAESLLTLINDILDFSKVDAGKLELEFLDFNLRQNLEDLAEAMALKAQEKGLELVLDLRQVKIPVVKGDPSRLRQILTNVVSNAIKFTDAGEVVVRCALTEIKNCEYRFDCSISDTGIGIPREKQDSLFDAFTQVDASTTRQYGGTGLGLAIVKQLCTLMGGEISLTSTSGEGTTFDFSLLFRHADDHTEEIPYVHYHALHALIVDDNATNREVLRGQLEHWGIAVEEAESGLAAKDILVRLDRRKDTHIIDFDQVPDVDQRAQSLFDVAIIDMNMPQMDGAALGSWICEHFACLPMVMMTSVNLRCDAKYFQRLGFSAFFTKPVSTSDLYNALALVTHQTRADRETDEIVTHYSLQTLGAKARGDDVVVWAKNTRILLVEDNSINQEVVRGILDDLGLSMDACANGLEALQALKRAPDDHPYTLVFMDCQMPEMDGYEASSEIRAGMGGARNRAIPIVAMTANAMKGDREKCLAAGMDDYVSKPIDTAELENVLRRFIRADSALLTSYIEPRARDATKPNGIENQKNNGTHHDVVSVTSHDKELVVSVWDQQAALKRVRGKPERLAVLCKMFVDDMPGRLTELRHEGDRERLNYEEISRLAHAIKGVAGNLSGLGVQSLAETIERGANRQEGDVIRLQIVELEQAFNQLLPLIDAFYRQNIHPGGAQ